MAALYFLDTPNLYIYWVKVHIYIYIELYLTYNKKIYIWWKILAGKLIEHKQRGYNWGGMIPICMIIIIVTSCSYLI